MFPKIVALARENEMQVQEDQFLDLLQPPEATPEDHIAVDDMISLQNTADMINETIDDNGEGLNPLAAVCLSVFSNIFRLTMDIFTHFHENAMRVLEANLSSR